jgi:hypothetical protein
VVPGNVAVGIVGVGLAAAARQSVARKDDKVSAYVESPNDAAQEIQAGASTDKVGHKQSSLGEQNDTASTTLPHSFEQISIFGTSAQRDDASRRSDTTVEYAAVSPSDERQDVHGGPKTTREGQTHSAFELQLVIAAGILPHATEHSAPSTASGQSVYKTDDTVAASVANPNSFKQEIQGGPRTEKVGQKQAALEVHVAIAADAEAHSWEQMQMVAM